MLLYNAVTWSCNQDTQLNSPFEFGGMKVKTINNIPVNICISGYVQTTAKTLLFTYHLHLMYMLQYNFQQYDVTLTALKITNVIPVLLSNFVVTSNFVHVTYRKYFSSLQTQKGPVCFIRSEQLMTAKLYTRI